MSSFDLNQRAAQVSPDDLAALHELAVAQGKQVQDVLDEAIRDHLERQNNKRPRQHVMASLAVSTVEFDRLYRDLVD